MPEIAISKPGTRVADSMIVDVDLVCPLFYPMLAGPAERFRRYASGLKTRGVNLRVFTIQYEGLSSFDVVQGIPVHRVPLDTGSRHWVPTFLYEYSKNVRQREQRPHVLQFFSQSQWHTPFIWWFKKLGTPCLLVFTLLGETDGSQLRKHVRKINYRWLFGPYDRVVTSSQVMTQELADMGVSRHRTLTIPNGVNLNRFRPTRLPLERTELRGRLGIDPDDEVVIFVGGILPRKGVDLLLTAWQIVARQRPKARLLLIGPRHEDQAKFREYRNKIDALVSESPAPERITFTGTVDCVESYMSAADVFVFPSVREGMPNVVPEAMATGLPCVVVPFHGLPTEFGEPGSEYRLVPRTPDAIADAVCNLLKNEGDRQALGKRARLWVERNLDVENSLDVYARLYKEIAHRSSKRVALA